MSLHDFFVVAYGRPGLSIPWTHLHHLTGGLQDKRFQHLERDVLLTDDLFGKGVHMIGEVTRENGSQMDHGSSLTIEPVDVLGKREGEFFEYTGGFIIAPLYKERNLLEMYLTVPAKCLQRIKHAIFFCPRREQVDRNTSGGMHPNPSGVRHRVNYSSKGIIFQRKNIEVCLVTQLFDPIGGSCSHFISQDSRVAERSAIYLQNLVA